MQQTDEKIAVTLMRETPVGATIKNSKIEYIFEFFVDKKRNELKVIRSFYTNKIRIFLNNNMVHAEDG